MADRDGGWGRAPLVLVAAALLGAGILAGALALRDDGDAGPGPAAGPTTAAPAPPAGGAEEGSRGLDAPVAAPGPPPRCPAPVPPDDVAPVEGRAPGGDLVLGTHAVLREVDAASLCAVAATAREDGARVVREDLRWSVVEREPGRFTWAGYDRVVLAAAQRGLTVLPILGSPPAWAAPVEDALPGDPRAFGRFAAAVVARYGPGGRFWRGARARPYAALAPRWFEWWNEPYVEALSGGRVDPAAFGALVRAAAPAARRANPRARFLLPAETTVLEADGGRERLWLAPLLDALGDVPAAADGIAVHPYDRGDPAVDEPAPDRFEFGRLDAIRAELVDRGLGRLPVWITEVGWSTCPAPPEPSDCVGEDAQARWLASAVRLARARPWVHALVVYAQADIPDRAPADREGFFGLRDADGREKPAAAALRAAARSAP